MEKQFCNIFAHIRIYKYGYINVVIEFMISALYRILNLSNHTHQIGNVYRCYKKIKKLFNWKEIEEDRKCNLMSQTNDMVPMLHSCGWTQCFPLFNKS